MLGVDTNEFCAIIATDPRPRGSQPKVTLSINIAAFKSIEGKTIFGRKILEKGVTRCISNCIGFNLRKNDIRLRVTERHYT
jgi:hypothetical protein